MKNHFSHLFLSKGVNYYTDDIPLSVLLEYTGFNESRELEELGIYVSEELIELLYGVDRESKPVLHTWGLLGERIDYVRISPSHWNALLKLQEKGVVSSIFSGSPSMMQHFVSGYVISDSGIFCTMTLTAQTAYGIWKYAEDSVREKFLPKFLDGSSPWFGATFYTETQGGSDLGANLTVAEKTGGKYSISGQDKYFASDAGIADAAIVTARLPSSREGAKGISVFMVPAYREDGSRNYNIRRLKDKLGTVAVPTGEVEFDGSEAYLLGSHENGIYIAMEILTVSRIDDAIAAVGIARKALWEAYRYAEKRTAFGKPLKEHPLMQRDLAELEAEIDAALALSLVAARKFDRCIGKKPPYDIEYQEARILGSIAKTLAADASAEVTRYSMEILGGIGFLEEFPMAKFHRDSIVTSIWEGTSNIQSLEFMEAMFRKNGLKAIMAGINEITSSIGDDNIRSRMEEASSSLKLEADEIARSPESQYHAKELLKHTGYLLAYQHMVSASSKARKHGDVLMRSAETYYAKHFLNNRQSLDGLKSAFSSLSWMGDK